MMHRVLQVDLELLALAGPVEWNQGFDTVIAA